MIIDCISDLHGFYPDLLGGDLLIIAGDLTRRDEKSDYADFMKWIDPLSFRYENIIIVAGNHDNLVQKYGKEILPTYCNYLCDSGTILDKFKIWGSPWTLRFPKMNPNCMAFTVDTEEQLAEKWAMIPDDVDILVTHSPGIGLHDEVEDRYSKKIHNVGSMTLTRWRAQHAQTLKLHVYGHIHEGYGIYDIRELQKRFGDPFIVVMTNASHVNRKYEPVNPPIRIIL